MTMISSFSGDFLFYVIGMYCADFSTQCVHDGYVTQIDGVCSCICVDGLDRSTGCSTIDKQGMYVCMYVRMYVCIYVCIYVGTYVCMHRYVCSYVYVCVFVSVCFFCNCFRLCSCVLVCLLVCVCLYVGVCIHVCMHVYMYVYGYVCMSDARIYASMHVKTSLCM